MEKEMKEMKAPDEIKKNTVADWDNKIKALKRPEKTCKNLSVIVTFFDTLIPLDPRVKQANDFGGDDEDDMDDEMAKKIKEY